MRKWKTLNLQHKSNNFEENTCYRPLNGSYYKSKPSKIEP